MGFEFADSNEGVVNIKVIGCGGGGCNAELTAKLNELEAAK